MRWWPVRRRRDEGSTDAARARRDADARLAAAEAALRAERARWPEVRRVSAALRDLRETNHFAELLEQAFRGPR